MRLVEQERDSCAAGAARPCHAELGFGLPLSDRERRDPASVPGAIVLTLPAGSIIPAVMLRGSIDRVDVVEAGGRRFGVALDYKSGKGKRYAEKFAALADFQLPVYCEAMRRFAIEPVGAVFLGIPDGERHGILREDAAGWFAWAGGKGVKKVAAGAFERRLDAARAALCDLAARAAVPDVEVRPRDNDCEWCELGPLCRVGTFAVLGGGDRDG